MLPHHCRNWLRDGVRTLGLVEAFVTHAQADKVIGKVAIGLDGRPWETLGWRTPAERLTEHLVASTA